LNDQQEKKMLDIDDVVQVNPYISFISNGVIDRLKALLDGKTLVCIHMVYGAYRFWLNPHKNVICCEAISKSARAFEEQCPRVTQKGSVVIDKSSVTQNPERFILKGYGEWAIEDEVTETVVSQSGMHYSKEEK
jgi:hypothetical protein